jgi:electron transfer flavoprotein alpha subunit
MIKVNQNRCDECGTCVGVCPTAALLLKTSSLEIIDDLCTDCGNCVAICPIAALKFEK